MGHIWPQTAMHACTVKMKTPASVLANKRQSRGFMGNVSVSVRP